MTSYRFCNMVAAAAHYYFRFRIFWCQCLQKVEVYQQTKSRRHISIHDSDITIFGLKKTNVRHIGILLPFRSRQFPRNLHIILHQATEFRPNRSPHCGNMMSYPCIKMAPAAAQYYFRFRICWYHCLQNVEVYQQTKSRRHISIDGWDITTSVFEKQTSAVLEFYFRFRSLPFFVICVLFCIRLPNFVQIGAPTAEIWRHTAATQYYFRFRICWCRCFQKVKVYQQTKFRRHISIHGRFGKTNVPHIGILLSVSISTIFS